MRLLELERDYCKVLEKQYFELKGLYEKLKSVRLPSLRRRDITYAIILRMRAYYTLNENIKVFLNKNKAPAASDFFAETVLFYLRWVLDKKRTGLKVCSERKIVLEKSSIQPDISVWFGEQLLAIIECKTQFGWNRSGWENDFLQRKKDLRKTFPKAKAFLVVMTMKNWSQSNADPQKFGKEYFILFGEWPREIKEDEINKQIINPIEDLFKEIIGLSRQTQR